MPKANISFELRGIFLRIREKSESFSILLKILIIKSLVVLLKLS